MGKETVKLLCQQGVCVGSRRIAALAISDVLSSLLHPPWVVVREVVLYSPLIV